MSSQSREKLEMRAFRRDLKHFFERYPNKPATEFDKVVLEATLQSFTSPGKFNVLLQRLTSIGRSVSAYSEYSIKDVTVAYKHMLYHGYDFSKITREDVIVSLESIT